MEETALRILDATDGYAIIANNGRIGERSSVGEWLSTKEVADILEVSESTVLRSLSDPAEADRQWGAGNWREKPLSRRRILQVRREAVEAKVKGDS